MKEDIQTANRTRVAKVVKVVAGWRAQRKNEEEVFDKEFGVWTRKAGAEYFEEKDGSWVAWSQMSSSSSSWRPWRPWHRVTGKPKPEPKTPEDAEEEKEEQEDLHCQRGGQAQKQEQEDAEEEKEEQEDLHWQQGGQAQKQEQEEAQEEATLADAQPRGKTRPRRPPVTLAYDDSEGQKIIRLTVRMKQEVIEEEATLENATQEQQAGEEEQEGADEELDAKLGPLDPLEAKQVVQKMKGSILLDVGPILKKVGLQRKVDSPVSSTTEHGHWGPILKVGLQRKVDSLVSSTAEQREKEKPQKKKSKEKRKRAREARAEHLKSLPFNPEELLMS